MTGSWTILASVDFAKDFCLCPPSRSLPQAYFGLLSFLLCLMNSIFFLRQGLWHGVSKLNKSLYLSPLRCSAIIRIFGHVLFSPFINNLPASLCLLPSAALFTMTTWPSGLFPSLSSCFDGAHIKSSNLIGALACGLTSFSQS